ncbi:hypothetical protein NMY22_g14136 [Coprinellus aureogranulatus]|nr:hypothetical protein NMY22_g14136 [Coprinellus aureogranulatus]
MQMRTHIVEAITSDNILCARNLETQSRPTFVNWNAYKNQWAGNLRLEFKARLLHDDRSAVPESRCIHPTPPTLTPCQVNNASARLNCGTILVTRYQPGEWATGWRFIGGSLASFPVVCVVTLSISGIRIEFGGNIANYTVPFSRNLLLDSVCALSRDRVRAFFSRSTTPQPAAREPVPGDIPIAKSHVPSASVNAAAGQGDIPGPNPAFVAPPEINPALTTQEFESQQASHSEPPAAQPLLVHRPPSPLTPLPQPSPGLQVAFNFTQTLLQRLPDILEMGDPAEVALGLAEAVVEIQDVLTIALKTSSQNGTLGQELGKLYQLKKFTAQKIADHEDVRNRIAEILHNVNKAMVQFQLEGGVGPPRHAIQHAFKFRHPDFPNLEGVFKQHMSAQQTEHLGISHNEGLALAYNSTKTSSELTQAEVHFHNMFVNRIERIGNVNSGTNYGNLIQSSFNDPRILESLPMHPNIGVQISEYLEGSRNEELGFVHNWTETSHELTLSVYGAVGTGKSTFARRLEEELRSKGRLAAALFMSFLTPDWGVETVARYIGAELGRNHPEATSSIVKAMQKCGSSTTSVRQLFEAFIRHPLLALQAGGPLTVIMDAFDEWKHHQAFLKCLSQLMPLSHLVKFVILHRTELRAQDIADISLHSHPLPPASTDVMRRYFQHHLASVEWGGDKGMSPLEVEKLAVKSKGWFVWARTVCSTMTKEYSEVSARAILQQALHSELTLGDSDALSELYRGAILRSFPSEESRIYLHKYLQMLIALVEPLSMAEFSSLIGMKQANINSIRTGLHALQTHQPNGSDELIHPAISSFHLSVVEFFPSLEPPSGDPSLGISTLMGHERMALACLNVLPKLLPPSSEVVASAADEMPPRYAIKNWIVHATHVVPPPEPNAPVRDWHNSPILVALDKLGYDTIHRWALALLQSTIWRDGVLDSPPRCEVGPLMEHFGNLLRRYGCDVLVLKLSVASLQIAAHLHPSASCWSSLARAYCAFSSCSNSPEYFERAIALHKHILHLATATDMKADLNGIVKMNLGCGIIEAWTDRAGTAVDTYLNVGITLLEEAVQLFPKSHNNCPEALIYLGIGLVRRGSINRVAEDCERAVQLQREALALCPEGHSDRGQSLMGLSYSLSHRFMFHQQLKDLDEAILLCRQALALCPEGHPDRSQTLNGLGHTLTMRSKITKELKDLDEAIQLHQEVLSLCPAGHPDRSRNLNDAI